VDRSPEVTALAWGAMTVAGLGDGKDFKLWPGGGRAWDWNETGMRHDPGIQPEDLEELLAHGATVVVLSRGMDLVLKTDPKTLDFLDEQSVEYHVEQTGRAVEIYNELAAVGAAVGGLFHSTC
jgi:hypothetical protein